MAALHERERNKTEKDRLFSLDEIEEVHRIAFGQWVNAHGIADWYEAEDAP